MFRENSLKNTIPFLLLAIISSILNQNYLVYLLFVLSILFSSIYIVKGKDFYNITFNILIISLFFDYALYIPYIEKIYLFHVILMIFTLLSMYKLFQERTLVAKLNKPILIIFLIWFIYMCISVAWSSNKMLSLKYIAIYLMMFAFIIDMMIYNINKERLLQTVKSLIFSLSLIIFIGLIEVLLGTQLPIKHYYDGFNLSNFYYNLVRARAIVFSFNTNNLAATLAILSPLLFFALYESKKLTAKIYYFMTLTILFGLIIITTSRTGIFSIQIVLYASLIYLILPLKNINKKNIILAVLIIVSFTFCKYNALNFMTVKNLDSTEKSQVSKMVSNKMGALKNAKIETGGSGSINVRWTIAHDVLDQILLKEKQFLGVGVGNVEEFIRSKDHTEDVFSPHCYAIEILGDFGIPGVILFGIYYLYLLLNNMIIGIRKKNIYCLGAAIGLLAFSTASFGPSSITYVLSYWVLMALSICNIQIFKKRKLIIQNTWFS